MYNVVISPSANADLFNALKYIAHELENPQAATKLADGVEACYEALADFPAAHELCRDLVLARMGYRPLVLERGADVETRTKKVEGFWQGGDFDEKFPDSSRFEVLPA